MINSNVKIPLLPCRKKLKKCSENVSTNVCAYDSERVRASVCVETRNLTAVLACAVTRVLNRVSLHLFLTPLRIPEMRILAPLLWHFLISFLSFLPTRFRVRKNYSHPCIRVKLECMFADPLYTATFISAMREPS